jgi:hypothetical protein
VPLDDLVGAPEVGDPRIHLKPAQVKGTTVIPLTRQPDGMQAWKIVIPTSKVKPEPRAHDGYEWIYVLLATCDSSSATRTGFSDPARSPNSTPRHHTGLAALGTIPLRS